VTPERRWCVLARKLSDSGQGGKRTPRAGRWQGLGASRNETGAPRLSPWSDPTTSTWIEEPKSPQALNFRHHRTVLKMAFVPMRLKPESGANRIKSADDAYSFMMHMRLSDRNKPHWQMARQALNHAGCSTTRVKSAIAFSLTIDGSGSRVCGIFGRLRPVSIERRRGAMRLLKRGPRALANRASGWAWNRTAHSRSVYRERVVQFAR
jgi:hypothetical protein